VQVGDGDVGALLVGVEDVDEVVGFVGVSLEELCVGVSSLDECVLVVGEELRLRLCDVVCR